MFIPIGCFKNGPLHDRCAPCAPTAIARFDKCHRILAVVGNVELYTRVFADFNERRLSNDVQSQFIREWAALDLFPPNEGSDSERERQQTNTESEAKASHDCFCHC